MTRQEIENQAMKLPPAEREEMAEHLLRSLDSQGVTDIEQAWLQEAQCRRDEMQSGRVQGGELYQ